MMQQGHPCSSYSPSEDQSHVLLESLEPGQIWPKIWKHSKIIPIDFELLRLNQFHEFARGELIAGV